MSSGKDPPCHPLSPSRNCCPLSMPGQTAACQGLTYVMEIWGGNAGVSKVSIRRCLRTGQNFDIVTGADLTKYHNQQVLLNYIRQHRPLVIVMGPPCTAFSSWSHINQYNAPNTYTASRQTGETLARLAARVASVQLEQGRHFIIENPRGSEMFRLPAFRALWNTGRVKAVNFPQCAVGLRSPEGVPLLKHTTMWASHPILLQHLQGLACTHTGHGPIHGSHQGCSRSRLSQVWPPELCRRLVAGVVDLKRTLETTSAYPVPGEPHPGQAQEETSGRRGRPRQIPQGIMFDCVGCRHMRVATDTSHTRNVEPPGLCRYPHVEPIDYPCPACRTHKRADHPSHKIGRAHV